MAARRPRLLATCAVALLSGAACAGEGAASSGGDRLQVVTTVAPITSIVANVVGDHADVEGIVPEGTDSHTFEPAPRVAEVLATADVVFVNGLGLEEPTRRLAEANVAGRAEIVPLGDRAIPADAYVYDDAFPRSGGVPNPHLWTDPPLVRRYAEIVRDTMVERDPRNAAAYRANYRAFSRLVDELDRAMRASFATVDPDYRKLLTYHDAYPYFARDYGWEVVGAIQPSSFDDPTPREVADLVEQVRDQGVPAIFGSEVFASPVLEQIGRETGVRYVDVLRDDDLPGEPGDPDHSWLGLMRFDFVTMVDALGGDPSALENLDVRDGAPDRAHYPQ